MNSGDWIEDAEQAHDFSQGAEAIKFAVERGLKNVEIIHAFPDPQYNISTGRLDFSR